METMNDHFVGSQGDLILIMAPPVRAMPKDEALRLAAWIVAQADPSHKKFLEILEAVEAS